jgi:hypothetical protein
MPQKPDSNEITSLNQGLINFDVADVTVEELERRLELAIGFAADGCDCPYLKSCGTYCSPPPEG